MVAKGDNTLSGKNGLDVENEKSSHLVKAPKEGRMLTPRQYFRSPKSHTPGDGTVWTHARAALDVVGWRVVLWGRGMSAACVYGERVSDSSSLSE